LPTNRDFTGYSKLSARHKTADGCTVTNCSNLSFPDGPYSPSVLYFCAAMLITMFKSKIHRVKVTEADLNYMGSITIDEALMEAANIVEGEKVQVVNNNNGERIETYVIPGERHSGIICLNGAAARRVQPGDVVIIITYAMMTPEEAKTFKPISVFPDDNNQLL